MRSRATKQRAHLRVLLLVVVGGIVFGIIGMHTLARDRVTPSAATHSLTAIQSMPAGTMTAETMGDHNQDGNGSSSPDDHCGMLALCLAALVGGALLVWGALAALRRRPITQLKRTAATVRTCIQLVFRPPPDLIRLSILRC